MKKIILATTLTLSSAVAMAQNYGNGYDYYGYTDNMVQAQPATYYTNEVPQAEVEEINYGYMPISQVERAWDLEVMSGIKSSEKYSGSSKNETKIVVQAVAEYRLDPWQKLFITLNHDDYSAGYSYALTNNLELGGGLGYREGRNSNSDSILAGMYDVDDTLTYMTFAKYTLNDYNLGIKLEKGIDSSNDGFSTELSAGYATMLNQKLKVGTKLATVYGDNTFMRQNYGVSSSKAIAGRAAHNTDAGFSEASIKTFASYEISGPHSIKGSVKYTKLLGDAKKSTIVKDDDDIALEVGYAYKF